MPPPYRPVDAEVALPAAGLALVPAPRFVIPGWAATGPKVILNRASFAGSEGIDLLIVQSLGVGRTDLGREVEAFARQEYVEAGVKNIRAVTMDDVDVAGPGARPSARVLMEGDGHLARLRMVVRGDQLEDGTLAIVAMSTIATMVVDEHAAEVDAGARTLRLIDGLEDGSGKNGFVVFSHDLDFSALLAATQAAGPSVVQVRTQDVTPEAIGRDVVRVLRLRSADLEQGAVVSIDKVTSRVRVLPIRGGPDRGAG